MGVEVVFERSSVYAESQGPVHSLVAANDTQHTEHEHAVDSSIRKQNYSMDIIDELLELKS